MSVLFSNNVVIIICHLKWIKQNAFKEANETANSLLNKMFEIKTPFLMDGEAKKLALIMRGNQDSTSSRKRKRINYPSQHTSKEFEAEVDYIKQQYTKILLLKEYKCYFNHITIPEDYISNNFVAREAANRFLEKTLEKKISLQGENPNENFISLKLEDDNYSIPPNSQYIIGDVFKLEEYIDHSYDIVVMDPPWDNKHIKRKKKQKGITHSYWTISVNDLGKIPLMQFLSPRAYVFIWISNNKRMNEELMDILNLWELNVIATWYWLKVTKSGSPVNSFDGQHRGKLPYEKILIASRFFKNVEDSPFPDKLIITSVPSGLHSHKPPLDEVIKIFHDTSSLHCMELFARYLIPGWMSIGLEAIKLNNKILFQE